MINLTRAFDFDKNKFGVTASECISQFGHLKIKSMTVFRRPLMKASMMLMNVVTWGEVQKRLDNSPYDTLFHLGCYIVLENGKLIEIDKQQTIKIRPSKIDKSKGTEFIDVPINKIILFAELIGKTLDYMGKAKFFANDGRNNNCQDFMIVVVESNKLNSPNIKEFIKQDTEFIFKNNSYFEKFLKFKGY